MSNSPQDTETARRRELASGWRVRIAELEARARQLRAAGDPAEAAEYEGAATDYRLALEQLGEGDETLEPVPGMPGCRRDPAGRVFYSSAWLGDQLEPPVPSRPASFGPDGDATPEA